MEKAQRLAAGILMAWPHIGPLNPLLWEGKKERGRKRMRREERNGRSRLGVERCVPYLHLQDPPVSCASCDFPEIPCGSAI